MTSCIILAARSGQKQYPIGYNVRPSSLFSLKTRHFVIIISSASLPDSRALPCAAHGKDKNTHGTAFAVRILIERTAKGTRRIFTRQRTLPCALGKGNA
jgi:hypothetical protein